MPGLSSNPHSHHSLRVEGMPMDIEKSRFNMIEQQIRPWDVLDLDVLDLLKGFYAGLGPISARR